MTQQPTQGNIRTFYILLVTQVFSMIGSRISSIAVGIHIYNQTGNATPLTLVAFFAVVPQVFMSSLSGVLADRWDRRLVMVLADAGQAIGTLLLLVSFASDGFQLWHLYAVAVIQSVFGVFQGPAFSASVTMLIPDEQRNRANTLMQLTQPSAGVIAPAIAGFVYALVDVEGAILIDLLTFVVAMIVVFSMHIPRPTVTAEGLASRGTVWKEMWFGFRYLWGRRMLLYVMLYAAMMNFMLAGMGALGTPYILARTGSETALGMILSVQNIGMLVGGIVFGVIASRVKSRMALIVVGVGLTGVLLAAVGLSQTSLALAVTMFLLLTPIPMVNAGLMSIMQAKVAPDLQGRVFAVMGQISMVLTPLSFLLVGPLADQVFEPAVGGPAWDAFAPVFGTGTGAGIGLMMGVSGAVVMLLSVAVFTWPRFRNLEDELPDYVPVDAASDAALNAEPIPADVPTDAPTGRLMSDAAGS